jgi:hypothetical protein
LLDTAEQASAANPLLSLTAAAIATGYHPDTLGRYIREGRLTNHGTPHRPLVRLGEVPRKPLDSHDRLRRAVVANGEE